ncbi:unnamed protein product [Closterium sp. NIES-64]|nr:unnamed protein product [Closterium sp. NIES-64]
MRSRAAGAAEPPESHEPPCCRAAVLPCCPNRPVCVLAFDAEGRAIDFNVWVDDLQLFLQCDRADGLSLFDLTSGASPAPAADADATVRSQWATRDAAARLAMRRHLPTTERAHFSQYKSAQTLYDAVAARYSSPATAALSRLMLPFLFPNLAAFPTVADLITHLRTSDTRYRAALPAEGVPLPPFCPLSPLLPRPTSLVLSRSVRRLPLAGDAALARARGTGAREELTGVVEAAVEAAEGVGVAVGVVAGVEVSVADVEAEAVAVGAEAAVVAEVEEAVVEEAELVRVALRRGAAPVVVSASSSSSSVLVTSPPVSSSVSGTLHVSVVGVLVRAPTSYAPVTARTAALGTGEAAALGASEAAALGASASASSGAGESALSSTASASASLTFTLDSWASRFFFQDRTTLTPLGRPVAVSLADPSTGPILSHFSTVLPCPAAPSGTLSGLYLPSFSTNLGRLPAVPHSSQFPPTEAPLQTLHMNVWGPARVRGHGHERYFLLVVDDYSHYTTLFP